MLPQRYTHKFIILFWKWTVHWIYNFSMGTIMFLVNLQRDFSIKTVFDSQTFDTHTVLSWSLDSTVEVFISPKYWIRNRPTENLSKQTNEWKTKRRGSIWTDSRIIRHDAAAGVWIWLDKIQTDFKIDSDFNTNDSWIHLDFSLRTWNDLVSSLSQRWKIILHKVCTESIVHVQPICFKSHQSHCESRRKGVVGNAHQQTDK